MSIAIHVWGLIEDRVFRNNGAPETSGKRVIVLDVPPSVADDLLEDLRANPSPFRDAGIPVFIIDEKSRDSLDPESPRSGKYAPPGLTVARNHIERNWVAICQTGYEPPDSNTGTSSLLEIDPAELLPEFILPELTSGDDADLCRRIASLARRTWKHKSNKLTGIFSNSAHYIWEVSKRVAAVSKSTHLRNDLLAAIGLPTWDLNGDEERPLNVLSEASNRAKQDGLGTLFDQLRKECHKDGVLPDDVDSNQVESALRECLGHLRKTAEDGGTWAASPFFHYSRDDASPQQMDRSWRDCLTVDVWESLLDGGRQRNEPEFEIRIKPSPEELTADVEKASILRNAREAEVQLWRKQGEVWLPHDPQDATTVEWRISAGEFEVDVGDRESFLLGEYLPENLLDSPMRVSARCKTDVHTSKIEYKQKIFCLDETIPMAIVDVAEPDATATIPARGKKSPNETSCSSRVRLPRRGSFEFCILSASVLELQAVRLMIEGAEERVSPHESSDGIDRVRIQVDGDEADLSVVFRNTQTRLSTEVCVEITTKPEDPGMASTRIEGLVQCHEKRQRQEPNLASAGDGLLQGLSSQVFKETDFFRPRALGLGTWNAKRDLASSLAIRPTYDPRPKDRSFEPPRQLLESRNTLRLTLGREMSKAGHSIEGLPLSSIENLEEEADKYLKYWVEWCEASPGPARWLDTTLLFQEEDPNPCAILLSPLHPLRINWLIKTHRYLDRARAKGHFAPFCKAILHSACPHAWDPSLEGLADAEPLGPFIFQAIAGSYWSLLVHEGKLSNQELPADLQEAGIEVVDEGIAMSQAQTKGMLKQVTELLPATSTITAVLEMPDSACGIPIAEGIMDFFADIRDPIKEKEITSFNHIAQLGLEVYARTAPSEEILRRLAAMADEAKESVKWHEHIPTDTQFDLAIHPRWTLVRPKAKRQQQGSHVISDPHGLFPVTPDWPEPRAESESCKINRPLSTLQHLEGSRANSIRAACALGFSDCVPELSMLFPTNLRGGSATSRLTGLPGRGLDSPTFAHAASEQFNIWDYGRPIAGAGFFVTMNRDASDSADSMNSIRAFFEVHLEDSQASDDKCHSLAGEFGQRGINLLRDSMAGGTTALGAIGQLLAARLLQPYGHDNGLFPIPDPEDRDSPLNILAPLDSFKQDWTTLCRYGLARSSAKAPPIPDYLGISIARHAGQLGRITITPIEVKFRTGRLTGQEKDEFLRKQCDMFIKRARLLASGRDGKSVDLDEESSYLNRIAFRRFMIELADVGLKTMTHHQTLGAKWLSRPGRALGCTALQHIYDTAIDETSIADEGRLIVFEDVSQDQFLNGRELSPTGFSQTLSLSRATAHCLAIGEPVDLPAVPREDWRFADQPRHVVGTAPNTDAVIPGPSIESEEEDGRGESSTTGNDDEEMTPHLAADRPLSTGTPPQARLGIDADGQETLWSPFRDGDPLPNAHCVIVGASGSGKTYTIERIMAPQVVEAGAKVFVLEFNDEFADFMTEDCRRLNVAMDGIDFNPLAIEPEGGQAIQVINHAYALNGILRSTFGLGVQQSNSTLNAIIEYYADLGLEKNERISEGGKRWPVFTTLERFVENQPSPATLLGRIRPLFDMAPFRGERGTIQDLLSRSSIMALKDMPDDSSRAAVSSILLRGAYQTLASQGECHGQLRNVVIIDEAHKVANSEEVETLIREIRKFGGGVWLSSQEPGDFDETVWQNCESKIIMKINDVGMADKCSKVLCSTKALSQELRELGRGEAFIRNTHWAPYKRIDMNRGSP